MIALATIGACFGALAIIALVLLFPHFIRVHDDLTELKHALVRLKEDFTEGLQELAAQSARPDETGVWLPRTDPITQGPAWVKQAERSVKAPSGVSPLAEIDDLMEALSATQRRN